MRRLLNLLAVIALTLQLGGAALAHGPCDETFD